jgi:conjugal transfer mating pair stabilization protein TraN
MTIFHGNAEIKVEMSRAQKEDRAWAKEQTKHLLKNKNDLGFSQEDILPQADKNKQFEAKNIESRLKQPLETKDSASLKKFVQSAPPKEQIEGTESFFSVARSVVATPQKSIGIASTQNKVIPAQEKIEKCQEAGSFQVSFVQKRIVQVTPGKIYQVNRCLGHTIEEKFFWETNAKTYVQAQKKLLSQSNTVASQEVKIVDGGIFADYKVIAKWTHKDNASGCDHCALAEVVAEPSSETEHWDTDFPERLSSIEGNPHCKLLYAQILDGPDARMINRKSVFRDAWERQLFFSCEPQGDSPCVRLRKQGGILLKRKCLQENAFGDCELWEKTYDLGKQAAHHEYTHKFDGEELWGFNDAFDSSYEKNGELGNAVASLSVFSDLKKDLENSGRDFEESKIEVFRGDALQCNCSFLDGVLYDCCKKMEGLAVKAHLARCNSEEQSLAERRQLGLCHYVGSKKEQLGTKTGQVFCCFSTKLARIVQEQGRSQLGIKWGKADAPECRGLSMQELQRLDLSGMDLSEVAEELVIDREELLGKVRATMGQLQTEGPTEASRNTSQIVQQHHEKVQNGD